MKELKVLKADVWSEALEVTNDPAEEEGEWVGGRSLFWREGEIGFMSSYWFYLNWAPLESAAGSERS